MKKNYRLITMQSLAFVFLVLCGHQANAQAANFEANNVNTCVGATVTFTNTSTGTTPNTTYGWNFGPGASPAFSTDPGPIGVVYSTTGQKTISLTITEGLIPNTHTKNNYITVNAGNTITLTSGTGTNIQSVCINSPLVPTITYATTGGTNAVFTDLPAGVIGVFNNNVITISGSPIVAGNYNYAVELTGGCGTASANGSITVNPLPIPTLISSDVDNAFCAGTSVTFTAGGGINYNFRVNGISKQNSAVNVYTTAALLDGQTVDVIITSVSACQATSAGITNTVHPLPTPFITGSSAICGVPTTNAYSVNNVIGHSYLWTVSGGVIASGQFSNAITVDWNTLGTGTVSVTQTVDLTGCAESATMNIIKAPATVGGTLSGSKTICEGSTSGVMTLNGHVGTILGWQYSTDLTTWIDTLYTATSFISIPLTQTTYFRTIIQSGACAILASTISTVTVSALPNLIITNPASVCAPNTVNVTAPQVTAGSSTGITLTYWIDQAATQALPNPDAVAVSGTYYIRAENTATCFVIEPITVVISPKPNLVITPNSNAVCFGEPLSLTLTGQEGSVWNWINPDTTNKNPVVLFPSIGQHIYSATATNLSGCTDTTEIAIEVIANPVVEISTSSGLNACINVEKTYTATQNPDFSYQWFINDVVVPNSDSHIFTDVLSSEDPVEIKVLATNINTSCRTADSIMVNPILPPVLIMDVTKEQLCIGDQTFITLSTSNPPANPPVYFAWGDGLQGNVLTRGFIPDSDTIIWAEAINATGCIIRKTVNILVRDTLAFTIDASTGNDTVCAGANVTFTGPASSSYKYQWYVGDIAQIGAVNQTFIRSFTQNATVRLIVTDTVIGCSGSAFTNIVTKNTPVFNLGPDQEICQNNVVTLEGPLGSGYTYTWFRNDENNPISTHRVLDFLVPAGTTTLRLEVSTQEVCTATDAVQITSKDLPGINIVINKAEICLNDIVTLTATTANTTSVLWFDGLTTFGPHIRILSPNIGDSTFIYWAQAVNTSGCNSRDTVTVIVNNLPVVNIQAVGGSTSINVNSPITIQGPQQAGYNYQWYLDGVAAGTNSHLLTFTVTEEVAVSLRITDGNTCTSVSAPLNIQAIEQPILSVTPSNQNVSYPSGITSFEVVSDTSWTVTENDDWLTIHPLSGSGNGTLTVNYEANPTLNIRTGQIIITASGGAPFVTTTLTQSGKDICQPDWTPVPDQEFNMQLIAQVIIDGIASTDAVLGAFVGEECRGIALPLEAADGKFFLSIGSNQESGETIDLRIWNCDQCQSCYAAQYFSFSSLTEIGSLTEPFEVSCGARLEIDFPSGYKWFSTNIQQQSMEINHVFSDLSPAYNDRLIGQSSFSLFTGESWLGSLQLLDFEAMYKLRLFEAQTNRFRGVAASIQAVPLSSGYSWLGYLPQECYSIQEALAGFNPNPSYNDRLIGQSAFAVYTGSSWIGSLTQLCPGEGFVLRLSNASTLNWPAVVPVAAFNANPKEGMVALTVNFIDQSTNSPTTWFWDFGDGNSSSEQNPTHTYQNVGSYTVQLTVSNSAGSNTKTKVNFIIVTENTLWPTGTVHCSDTPTAIVDVINPITGKTWMDRNLGASQAATSSADELAYGDLYQWGRFADGHQCRNSATTTTLSSTDQPGHGDFIIGNFDWRSPQNDNLWQGADGINNPCPSGYRIPTNAELEIERLSWSSNNATGAFNSSLKFPVAGGRSFEDGSLYAIGSIGNYWSATIFYGGAQYLGLNSATANMENFYRTLGFSVRCIKETSPSQGTINTLGCSSATNTGILTHDSPASEVSSTIAYTGGNGGTHNGQTVNSTGVTGLMATLAEGSFATGNGTLTYTITGIPESGGTASFALNIGGQSCILSRTVNPTSGSTGQPCPDTPSITDIDGNSYNTVLINNQCWMKENLKTTRYQNGTNIIYPGNNNTEWENNTSGAYAWYDNDISWKNLYGALYNWHAVNNSNSLCPAGWHVPDDGEWTQLTNYVVSQGYPNDDSDPNGTGNALKSCRQVDSPLGSDCNTSEHPRWDPFNTNHGFDAVGFTALPGGYRTHFPHFVYLGNSGLWWSSTEHSTANSWYRYIYGNNVGIANNPKANGFSVRCIKDTPEPTSYDLNINVVPSNTGSVSGIGTYQAGTAVSITATAILGWEFLNWTGDVTYLDNPDSAAATLSMPQANVSLTANFQEENSLWPPGTIHCNGIPTEIVDVTNPITGRTWMDRNLGASQAATSSTNELAYGDLYQWGRFSDGHQCRSSATTTTLSSADLPGHGNFILTNMNPQDWRSPQNSNLWQGTNSINQPCPNGYRLPTASEFEAELSSWSNNNATGAINSPLKLPNAGFRAYNNGSMGSLGTSGYYWSSNIDGNASRYLTFGNSAASAFLNSSARAYGMTVRCIKE